MKAKMLQKGELWNADTLGGTSHNWADMILWTSLHGLFQKSLHRCIYEHRLNLYRAKRKPFINQIQKCHYLLRAGTHLTSTEAKWNTALFFGNHGSCVLRAAFVLLAACSSKARFSDGTGGVLAQMGNMHICGGTIDAKWYIQVLEQTLGPCLF